VHLVVYSDAPYVGGAEIAVGRLLGELDPEIRVTAMGTTPEVVDWIAARRAGGAATEVVPSPRRRWDPGALAAHVRALRRLRPDVLQLNLITPWSCRYALLAGIVLRQRGMVAVEQLPHPSDSAVHRRFKRLSSRRLAAHVAVGEGSARDVERYASLRPGSIRVIHHGVPDVPLGAAARPEAAFVVGSIGRLDAQKGLDVLVDALPSVPDAKALLVGDGPEKEALLERAAAAGVADRVTVTGWRDDARDYLGALDAFVLPSRFEGFPQAVVEAMLAERAVVASNVGSVADAVVDGDTGLLVPADDAEALAAALRRLRDDPELRRELGRRAREKALHEFSVDRMARAYEALYREIA
jgi:glycosyltransferase involved in cell wall biosynthesis